MKLSPNFTLLEFTNSMKAHELGIINQPNMMQISRMEFLCYAILEPIRDYFKAPVKILSGFRSPELNAAVGGSPTSQHTTGEAADIEVAGVANDKVWLFIEDVLSYDQVIAEKLSRTNGGAGWVHVSHKAAGKQRREALSFLGNGKYVSGLHYID